MLYIKQIGLIPKIMKRNCKGQYIYNKLPNDFSCKKFMQTKVYYKTEVGT